MCIDTTQSSTEPTWASSFKFVQVTAIHDTPLVPSQSSGSANESGSEPEAASEGFPKNKRRKVQVQEQPAEPAQVDDSAVQAEADRPQQLKDARLVAAAVKQGLGIPGQYSTIKSIHYALKKKLHYFVLLLSYRIKNRKPFKTLELFAWFSCALRHCCEALTHQH